MNNFLLDKGEDSGSQFKSLPSAAFATRTQQEQQKKQRQTNDSRESAQHDKTVFSSSPTTKIKGTNRHSSNHQTNTFLYKNSNI